MKEKLKEILSAWKVAQRVYESKINDREDSTGHYNDGRTDVITDCIIDIEMALAEEEDQEYNPFIQGEPKEAGWYITAVHLDNNAYTEVFLFFNPDLSVSKWRHGSG